MEVKKKLPQGLVLCIQEDSIDRYYKMPVSVPGTWDSSNNIHFIIERIIEKNDEEIESLGQADRILNICLLLRTVK